MKRDGDEVAAGYRHARLQALVLEELRAILRDEVENPALSDVHLTSLSLSVDYRHARVHFTLPTATLDRRRVEQGLVRATPFLRRQLGDAVELKRNPDLRFVFDGVAIPLDIPIEPAVEPKEEIRGSLPGACPFASEAKDISPETKG